MPLQSALNAASQSRNPTGASIPDISTSMDDQMSQSMSPEGAQAEPSSGAHRRHGSVTTGLHRDADNLLKQRPEKRKRSRVTPEQLIELEREFSTNRTPTGAERKSISDRLGMNERQTQIWFQNRRAKAKHQEAVPATPDRTNADGSAGPSGIQLESFIAQLIREKEPVTLIPCSDLKIGHWTRINPSALHHEVLAYTSQSRQCISWFIRSSGLSFKIEVPFSSISSAQLVDTKTPQLITLVLQLHTVPLFFVQQPDVRMRHGETMADVRKRIGIAPHLPLPNIGATPGEWVASNDWTQNQQASRVLRHELTGPRTSILPGVRGFPKEFGLFQDPPQVESSNPSSLGDLMGLQFGGEVFDRRSNSPTSWWNDPHQLPSAHTPSSYSGYESSSHASQYSISSYASGQQSAHTPASSTHSIPDLGDLNLGHENPSSIAQPVPVHANLGNMPLISEGQRAQSIPAGSHLHQDGLNMPPSASSDLGLGFDAFVGADDLSQNLMAQHAGLQGTQAGFGLQQPQSQGQMGLFSTGQDFLTADVSLSRYAQQRESERRLSDAGISQQTFPDFGMNPTGSNFGSYASGAINLPFEVDASFGTGMSASAINAYPLQQPPAGTLDDSHLFLQQSGADHTFSNVTSFAPDAFSGTGNPSYGMGQFSGTNPNQAQQISQAQALNNSQPGSRRSSVYGYQ